METGPLGVNDIATPKALSAPSVMFLIYTSRHICRYALQGGDKIKPLLCRRSSDLPPLPVAAAPVTIIRISSKISTHTREERPTYLASTPVSPPPVPVCQLGVSPSHSSQRWRGRSGTASPGADLEVPAYPIPSEQKGKAARLHPPQARSRNLRIQERYFRCQWNETLSSTCRVKDHILLVETQMCISESV